MQYDVFISYSSKDSATAQAICHELEDNHIRCWMAPRDIPIGSKYATVITEAIISSKAVVLVFSERSAISPWVESEINIAFSNRKPIIPYKIDKAHLEDYSEFYLMLNNRHWIEAYPDFKTRFAELVGVVSKVVKPHVESFTTNRQTEENSPNSPSVHREPTRDERWLRRREVYLPKGVSGGSSKRSAESTSLLKKLLFPVVACFITALAVIFWPELKNEGGDTPVKTEVVTQQSEILPPAGRQNDTNQQQQTAQLQQSQSVKLAKEEPAVSTTTELYVTTTPPSAVVYVDGTRVGITPIKGKEIDCGIHHVKLSMDGYEDKTFTRIFGDSPIELNEALVKKTNLEPVAIPTEKASMRRDIFFTIGNNKIESIEMVKVKEIVAFMEQNPDMMVEVTGYADKSTGTSKANKELAWNRAAKIRDALIEVGLQESRIRISSMGDKAQPYFNPMLNNVVICIVR